MSQVAHVQAGLRGDQLEEALAEHGLTTGLYPQSIAISTVGGWIAASSAGQASTGFGAIEDVLLGLTAVLPAARYLAAWDQAVRSCAAVGGTITHHHGVGRLKARYLATELGETGVDVLTRIKAALDPAGIMNPRVLLP